MIIQSDNQAAVSIMNNLTSSCPLCMKVVGELVFFSMENNVQLLAEYLPGKQNVITDALSRLQFSQFFKQVLWADQDPSPVPWSLWRICEGAVMPGNSSP